MRADIEYRFDARFPEYLFRIKDGKIDAIVPANSFGPVEVSWSSRDTFFGSESPYWIGRRHPMQPSDNAFIENLRDLEARGIIKASTEV